MTREALVQEGLQGLAAFADKLFQRFDNLRLLFIQADSPMTPEKFCLLTFFAGGVGVAIAFAIGSPIPLYPVAALSTGCIPLALLLFRRRRSTWSTRDRKSVV